MSEELKYYDLKNILKFLGIDYEFERKSRYPFTKNPKQLSFSWGQILIPKYGIHEVVKNKISDVRDLPITEITMMYQVPFKNECPDGSVGIGVINQDIRLTFRYDKEYKYGEITKSIYEVCFYILEHANFTNNFYIITNDDVFTFFSYYIIPNQWGIGRMTVSSPCVEKWEINEDQIKEETEECTTVEKDNSSDVPCQSCSHLIALTPCSYPFEASCSKFNVVVDGANWTDVKNNIWNKCKGVCAKSCQMKK